ncbi:hypothetical protein [Paraburkholderia sp. BCC1884]|uniref:hypothetical protein n=1 Tax=Paraburkholderia sp. BCC1884 TaxID=2562668 RepID=UPI0021B4C833|nr:hypothetical protein [Paraburkholderia sp. BCC1884]
MLLAIGRDSAHFCIMSAQTSYIEGNTMKPMRLRVPREEAPDFADDLTAWASSSGVDPRLTIANEPGMTTNLSSPILYLVYVSESFFEQFPEWRMYIEQ